MASSAQAAPPVIGAISNQTVVIDRPTDAYHLTVSDAETPELSLQFRGLSSNTNLVPHTNIFFGIAFNTWYLTTTPTFGMTGACTISVIVRDQAGEEATNSFLFTVTPAPATHTRFANTNAITIPGVAGSVGPASPYPSTNTVSGKSGWITNMTMTFSRLTHERIQDVNMLLVSPAGTGVVLFSEVSGQNRKCTNVTVTFDDNLFYALPSNFDLWSEPLRPADFQAGDDFPGATWTSAPVALSSFYGAPANGAWKLYVYDDTGTNNGFIAGGWSLLIATSTGPLISDITDRTILVNTNTGPIAFTVRDPDTAASNLVLTASSSNTNLVTPGNIVFSGSGTNRTVTVTPNAGQTGVATITVTVSDGGNSASDAFVLTVSSGNTPPTIAAIPNQTTLSGRAVGPFNISIADAETPVGNLILTGSSSNTNLVPNGNIIFFNSGVTTLTVQPLDGATGSSVITINVSDGISTTSTNFTLTVNGPGGGTEIFNNAASLSIPAGSAATTFPSTNIVSGMTGSLSAVTLTLKAMTHGAPHDLEMMLVSPGGQKAIFFARVGGGTATNITVTVDDSAAYQLPPSPYAILTGTYRSADFGHDSFPAPAPSGPYGTNLAAFIGSAPNGTWSLYVINDPTGTAAGTIANGWSLALTAGGTAAPTISDIPNQTILVNSNTGALPFTIGDPDTAISNLVLTAASSNTGLVPTNNISFGGSGSNRTVTVTPGAGQSGTSTITITVSDGSKSSSDSFLLTVNSGTGNTPPTIAPIPDKTTLSGRAAGPFNIAIGDAETPTGNLVLTGNSSNTNLVPNANIIFFNGGGITTLTVQPTDGVTGVSIITVNVSDGIDTVSTNFTLTVSGPGAGAGIFDKTNTLSIPLTNVASVYPSTNAVAGLAGTITNLTLTLKGLTHSDPHDLEMMLVSPGGQKSVFFSHVGGGTATNLTVTVDDTAAYQLPPSPFAILTGTYRSADFGHGTFPAPAPAGPYGTNMSAFVGASANGNWLLYLMNDPAGTGSGTLAKGWSLFIATDASNTPPIATNMVVAIPEDTATNLVLVGSDAGGPVTFAVVQAPTHGALANLNTNTGAVTYRPATNYFGPDFFTYRVSDGSQFATGTVSVTVSSINDAPVAASLAVTLPEDGVTNLTLLGSDVESAVTYGLVSNPSHGTLAGLNTNTGAVTYRPATNYFGSDAFSFRVTDGSLFATGTVSITVTSVDDPAVANNLSISLPKDTATNLVLTATDIDTTNTVADLLAVTAATTPNGWTLSAGASKEAAVAANDGDTSYLVSGSTSGTQQQFTVADPVHIQPGDSISSVTLRAICRRNSTPGGSYQLTAVLGAATVSGGAHATSSSYVEETDTFTAKPGGGPWTLAEVQNLQIRIQNTQARDIACTKFEALVSFIGNTNRTYTILSPPAHGSLGTLNTNSGTVSYTPASSYAGTDSFTFAVNAGGVVSTGLVSIVVTGGFGPVTINTVEFISATQLRLTGTGDASIEYRIQASTNLFGWSDIGTAAANGSGVFQYVDGAITNFATRYYRVAAP